MTKHTPRRQCCGTAKSARSVTRPHWQNGCDGSVRHAHSSAGWVAAQDPGGKAPLGEEVLEPDTAEPDKVEKGWLAGETATGDWGGMRTRLWKSKELPLKAVLSSTSWH